MDINNAQDPEAQLVENADKTPVSPTEFAKGVGTTALQTAKGAITGAIGAPGDVISLAQGIKEVLSRTGDDDAVDAFIRGMEEETILPTTEDVNKFIDRWAPQSLQSGSMAQDIGEFASPGAAAKGAIKGAKKVAPAVAREAAQQTEAMMRRQGLMPSIVPEGETLATKSPYEAVGLTDEGVEEWRAANRVQNRQQPINEVKQAAIKLRDGEISSAEYRQIVKQYQPIIPLKEVPKVPTLKELVAALNKDKVETGVVGINKSFKDGDKVASRLDIPAYDNYDTWVVSLHDGTKTGGKSLGYAQTAVLKNVDFRTAPSGALKIATKDKAKETIARIHGDWVNESPESVAKRAEEAINSPEWVQVGMNPYRHSYFYDKADGTPVVEAQEIIQVGPLVLAKKPKYASPDDPQFRIRKNDETSPTFFSGGVATKKHWLDRATDPSTPSTEDNETVRTATYEQDGKYYLVPTIRMGEDGKLYKPENPLQEAINNNDAFIFSSEKEANDMSKQISEHIGKKRQKKYAKGGNVEQMKKLFAEGGMMDDSGESVNGVEVPPGSLREEVADDIPAQLSEGEFVVPADVVRYIGLEKLMAMRDKAKQGLERMQEMGQMGNADEVDDPDQTFAEQDDEDFEAEIDDIMASEGGGYALGGMVTPENVDRLNWTRNPTVDVRYFKHPDGRVMFITYINGKPTTAIPEGFKQTDEPVEKLVGKAAEEKASAGGGAPVSTSGGGGDSVETRNYWVERENQLIDEATAKYGPELGRQIGIQAAKDEMFAKNEMLAASLYSAARQTPLGIITGKISDALMGTTNGMLPADKAAPVTTIDISKAQPMVPGGAPVISSRDLPSVSGNTTPVVGIDVSKAAPVVAGGAPVVSSSSSSGPGSTVTVGSGRSGADTADPGMPTAPAPAPAPAPSSNPNVYSSSPSGGESSGGSSSSSSSSSSSNDSAGQASSNNGTHICTASYNSSLITPTHFKSLKHYGVGLRKNDPYLMRAYDSFGPKLASYVGKSSFADKAAKFLTDYYKSVQTKDSLSATQKVFSYASDYILRPAYRIIGWTLVKFVDKK